MGRLGRIVLVVCLVAVVVVPTSVQAMEPATTAIIIGAGVALSAATITAIAAVASTYTEGRTFKQNVEAVGATVAQGMVVQGILNVTISTFGAPGLNVYIQDGRLARACIAWLKTVPGAWARVTAAADDATTADGVTTVPVDSAMYDDLGFLTAEAYARFGAEGEGFDNANGYASGFLYGEPADYFNLNVDQDYSVRVTAPTLPGLTDTDAHEALWELYTEPGSNLKVTFQDVYALNSSYGSWYAYDVDGGTAVLSTPQTFFCAICEETLEMGTARAGRIQFYMPAGGVGSNAKAYITGASVSNFLAYHGTLACMDAAMTQDTADIDAALATLAARPTAITYTTEVYNTVNEGGDYAPTAPGDVEDRDIWTTIGVGIQTLIDVVTDGFHDVAQAGAERLEQVQAIAQSIAAAMNPTAIFSAVPTYVQTWWDNAVEPFEDAFDGLRDLLWPFQVVN